MRRLLVLGGAWLLPLGVWAQASAPAVVAQAPAGPTSWIVALSVLPALLIAATCFGKIAIVLTLLRAGLGAPDVPPTSLLTALAVALTLLVMAPVGIEIAASPQAKTALEEAQSGDPWAALAPASTALAPLARFLEAHTQPQDTALFQQMARQLRAPDEGWLVRIPAFLSSEIRDAFRIGVLVLLPFLVIDLLVGVLLHGLGVSQLEPRVIALPLKLGVLVATDGLALILRGLLLSYT